MAQLKQALNRDLLYDVAEGLFSSIKFNSNKFDQLRTNFMLINKDCMAAFLSFYSKLNMIEISRRNDYVVPGKYRPIFEISLSNSQFLEEKSYSGKLLAFLIKNGKFNPKEIIFGEFFEVAHCGFVGPTEEQKKLEWQRFSRVGNSEALDCRNPNCLLSKPINQQTTPLQSLCMLLGLHGFDDFSYSQELNLDFFEIKASSGFSFGSIHVKDLGYYLALNAKEAEVSLNTDVFEISCEKSCAKVSALRTEKWSVYLTCSYKLLNKYSEFPTTEWIELLTSILSSCPNLKKLLVVAKLNTDREELLDVMQIAVKAITNEVLSQVLHIREECIIEFSMLSSLHKKSVEKFIEGDEILHEVFQNGDDLKQLDKTKILRLIKLNEKVLFIFGIIGFEFTQDSDEEYDYSHERYDGDSDYSY